MNHNSTKNMFYQSPILISCRDDGLIVATSVIEESVQAVAHSRSHAKKLLERRMRKLLECSCMSLERLKSVVLEKRSFPAQPMHIQRHRRYPAGPPMTVPVRYVKIVDNWDKLFGILPDFGIHFYCPVEADFDAMLQETVRSMLASISPEEMVRCWPPNTTELDWLRVKLKSKSRGSHGPYIETLASVAEPLGKTRRPLLPAEIRESELRQIRENLLHSNCLLVGETGVGKTTLMHIATRDVFQKLRMEARQAKERTIPSSKFWLTSASRLIAGMRYLGQWQERLERIISELGEVQGVLIVESLRDLISIGGQSPTESLGAFLVPYLRTGQLRMACEATPSQVEYCQRTLPGLIDQMAIVRIEPLQPKAETDLVRYVLSQSWEVPIANVNMELSTAIQRLCRQFLTSRPAPSASIAFVEQWVGKLRRRFKISTATDGPKGLRGDASCLTTDNAIEEFSRWTGLPQSLLRDQELLERETVVRALSKEVIGQPEACNGAASVVMRLKSSMNDVARPFGCLLYCGPTGVGKTQLAKSLAKYLFGADGQKTRLVRLDMSEYQSGAAGQRFLNDANGEPAKWIQQIRNQPLQVLLFDEIEKASSEVFDILLSLLDEGRLTDRYGNLTNFRSSVVLMTSNLGSTQQSLSGFQGASAVDYASSVRKALRPEFINRLDAIVPFFPLQPESISAMTRKELNEVREREGVKRLGLRLIFSDALVQHIASIGFSSTLGARPLQRTIENVVMGKLARWMVESLPPPNSNVQMDWDDTNEEVTLSINTV